MNKSWNVIATRVSPGARWKFSPRKNGETRTGGVGAREMGKTVGLSRLKFDVLCVTRCLVPVSGLIRARAFSSLRRDWEKRRKKKKTSTPSLFLFLSASLLFYPGLTYARREQISRGGKATNKGSRWINAKRYAPFRCWEIFLPLAELALFSQPLLLLLRLFLWLRLRSVSYI